MKTLFRLNEAQLKNTTEPFNVIFARLIPSDVADVELTEDGFTITNPLLVDVHESLKRRERISLEFHLPMVVIRATSK